MLFAEVTLAYSGVVVAFPSCTAEEALLLTLFAIERDSCRRGLRQGPPSLIVMASNLKIPMASNLVAMASNLLAMASNLVAMASNLLPITSSICKDVLHCVSFMVPCFKVIHLVNDSHDTGIDESFDMVQGWRRLPAPRNFCRPLLKQPATTRRAKENSEVPNQLSTFWHVLAHRKASFEGFFFVAKAQGPKTQSHQRRP